ncbi:2196_t:CDS:2, partial [Ambispora gerdemannii]
LIHYEPRIKPLQMKQLEGWFDAIFGQWLSIVLLVMFEDYKPLDSSSISIAKRKNRKRARKERTKIGRKLDGIFRTYDANVEYGAIEVKSSFVQINSTEQLKEGLKLGKSMHDMLVCLTHLVKSNEEKVRQLQVVGLQHSGREEFNEIPVKKDKGFNYALIRCLRVKVVNEESANSTEEESIQVIVNSDTTTPPPTISFPWSFDT